MIPNVLALHPDAEPQDSEYDNETQHRVDEMNSRLVLTVRSNTHEEHQNKPWRIDDAVNCHQYITFVATGIDYPKNPFAKNKQQSRKQECF